METNFPIMGGKKHNLDPEKANDSTDDPDEDILHNLAEFQNGSDQ